MKEKEKILKVKGHYVLSETRHIISGKLTGYRVEKKSYLDSPYGKIPFSTWIATFKELAKAEKCFENINV